MKRYIILVIDLLLAVYLVLAVTAFNNPKPTVLRCTKVNIDIADESTYGFLDAKEIRNILKRKNLYPMGMPLNDVSPRKIEEVLSSSPFVSTAQCSKTKSGHIRITVTQRSPIVRVMSINADDYYLDENGGIMPNSKYFSDLIIVTGNVSRKFAQDYISVMAKTIMASDLWRNQIEQINVLEDQGIEIVPRVGDHIVFLGYFPLSSVQKQREEEVNKFVMEKLSRLQKFYTYGLPVAGWNKYERIDVQYSNQIICKKRKSENATRYVSARVDNTEEVKKQETETPAGNMTPASQHIDNKMQATSEDDKRHKTETSDITQSSSKNVSERRKNDISSKKKENVSPGNRKNSNSGKKETR